MTVMCAHLIDNFMTYPYRYLSSTLEESETVDCCGMLHITQQPNASAAGWPPKPLSWGKGKEGAKLPCLLLSNQVSIEHADIDSGTLQRLSQTSVPH